jgi:hypothetical protein
MTIKPTHQIMLFMAASPRKVSVNERPVGTMYPHSTFIRSLMVDFPLRRDRCLDASAHRRSTIMKCVHSALQRGNASRTHPQAGKHLVRQA